MIEHLRHEAFSYWRLFYLDERLLPRTLRKSSTYDFQHHFLLQQFGYVHNIHDFLDAKSLHNQSHLHASYTNPNKLLVLSWYVHQYCSVGQLRCSDLHHSREHRIPSQLDRFLGFDKTIEKANTIINKRFNIHRNLYCMETTMAILVWLWDD